MRVKAPRPPRRALRAPSTSRGQRPPRVYRADPAPAELVGLPGPQGQGCSWAATQALLTSELLLLLAVSPGSPLCVSLGAGHCVRVQGGPVHRPHSVGPTHGHLSLVTCRCPGRLLPTCALLRSTLPVAGWQAGAVVRPRVWYPGNLGDCVVGIGGPQLSVTSDGARLWSWHFQVFRHGQGWMGCGLEVTDLPLK